MSFFCGEEADKLFKELKSIHGCENEKNAQIDMIIKYLRRSYGEGYDEGLK